MRKLTVSFVKDIEDRVGDRRVMQARYEVDHARKKKQLDKLRHFKVKMTDPVCYKIE